MSTRTTYCTILARNYLPKALTLGDSLRAHHPDVTLVVLLIDHAVDTDLPQHEGVRIVSTAALGLPLRDVLNLAASYDLVEFATSVKPMLLKRLLAETDQVVYLDPDTYVTSPMVELTPALEASEGGIVLTPHFLDPVPPGQLLSEGHLLNVGVYNLGFCAVDRRSIGFLDWWWGHLREQCLHDPLSGLFVDQKWVDIGSTLWRAAPLRHRGYNTGVGNLHERPVSRSPEGVLRAGEDPLRLFHFHAFEAENPNELSTRLLKSSAHLRESSDALDALCVEYADQVLLNAKAAGEVPDYPYWTDTRGRTVSRHVRRAFRLQLSQGAHVPSPFLPEEADAFDAWRRSARKLVRRGLLGDAMKSVRLALPDEYAKVRDRFPKLAQRAKSKYVGGSGIWG